MGCIFNKGLPCSPDITMGNFRNQFKFLSPPQSIHELRNLVNFTPEEIQNWYIEYTNCLTNDISELTREEFIRVYSALFPGDASEFAEHVFRTFDQDGNGTVDFKEFLVGLYVAGGSSFERHLIWAFRMYDINNDGYISKAEMSQIIHSIYKMVYFNITSSKSTAPDELSSPDKLTEKLFKELDTNEDGLISFDEFREGAKNDPMVINMLLLDPE